MFIFNRFKKKAPASKAISNISNKEQVQKDNTEVNTEEEYEIVEKEILPEKMICPDCGGITLAGLDFCDKCGGELINHDN